MPSPSKLSYFYLSIASLSLGWMVGSAVSPVSNIVVTSITSLLVIAVTLFSGLPEKPGDHQQKPDLLKRVAGLNMLPVALLTVGLAMGSAAGIMIRTHRILAPKEAPITSPGLYAIHADACSEMRFSHGKALEGVLLARGDAEVEKLVKKANGDSLCLEIIKQMLCTQPQ